MLLAPFLSQGEAYGVYVALPIVVAVSVFESKIASPRTWYTTTAMATRRATPTAYSANSAPVSSFKKLLNIFICSFDHLWFRACAEKRTSELRPGRTQLKCRRHPQGTERTLPADYGNTSVCTAHPEEQRPCRLVSARCWTIKQGVATKD